MSSTTKQRFATRAIHGGQSPDPSTGAIMPPIYATSTYVQSSPGVHKGFDYGRSHNPTRWAWERNVADLEGGAAAFAFASGLAAIATVLEFIPAGSHIVCGDDVYGGTFRLLDKVRRHSAGLTVSYVDLSNTREPGGGVEPNTRLVWLETPTNPLLKLADLARDGAITRSRGSSCRGRQHVRESLQPTAARTRHRHSSSIQRQVPERSLRHHRRHRRRRRRPEPRAGPRAAQFLQNAVGAIAGPFDSFLALRGLKTLALRMQRHNDKR